MEDELKGLGEVPSTTRRGVSLLPGPGESSEAFNKRKTMAAVAEDEEVDEAFVEKARNLNEMKNMNEKPGGKNRGCSLTPAKEKKLTDPRKTIAPKEVDEKFVAVLKIQSELVKMDEQPAALNTKRAATMMPEDFSKTADQRKSLAPGEAREDFIQFALIQNEMKNIHDEPSVAATKRARSVSPEKKIKPNNRMTIIPQAGEASKDFLKFIDEQNQTKTAEKSSDVEEIDQGESSDESDANEEVVGAMTKTMRESDLPSVEVILDSDEEAEEALENSAQEVPETTAEEASEISVEIHKKIEKIFEVVVEIPEKAEKIDEMSEEVVEIPEKILKETEKVVQILKQTGKISETLEENKEILEKTVNISQETKKIVENPEKNFEKIEKIPEEIPENISEELFEATSIENPEDEAEEIDEGSTEVPKSPEESSKLVPVIEPTCIVKSAYLTTEDAAKVEAIEIPPETPRRRKRAIDYAALDSGSKRTPRRGRSASIDTAPKSLVKRKLTPMKQEPKKLAEQPIEEDVEAVIDITLKIEGELLK